MSKIYQVAVAASRKLLVFKAVFNFLQTTGNLQGLIMQMQIPSIITAIGY
jgi:hypothetical protein